MGTFLLHQVGSSETCPNPAQPHPFGPCLRHTLYQPFWLCPGHAPSSHALLTSPKTHLVNLAMPRTHLQVPSLEPCPLELHPGKTHPSHTVINSIYKISQYS